MKTWVLMGGGILSQLMLSGVIFGGVIGSGHDFSGLGWAKNEICLPCHTPHNAYTFGPSADGTNQLAPLWNHTASAAVYTLYASPTNTLDVAVNQPGSVSKACLSCHDGTVALDSFGGVVGSINIFGSANLGTDLNDDHPIGIDWNHQSAGGNCTGCHPMVWDPVISALVVKKPNTPMFSGRVECPSCHDPHNGFGFPYLTRVTTAGSVLCFSCHGDK